jgi:hypothetical protein
MQTLDPTVRLSHRPGTVQLDQAAPETTLSVMPYGAHLVPLWTLDQARAGHVALGRLLAEVGRWSSAEKDNHADDC